MKTFKDILEDVYTSEYKEKKFVGQDGKTHTRKIRPKRIEFQNSKANAEPAKKDEMQEELKIEEGSICSACAVDPCICDDSHGFVKQESYDDNRKGFSKRKREDDEYHTPDPVSRTHKIGFHVSKDGGEKHHRTVTLSNSTKTPDEAKATAKAHLEKQGYKIHEETELAEDIKTEYNSLKKHDIKHLRGLIKTQHKIIDTSEFKTKEHAISHYLRAKHGNKKVADAFGLKEDFETIEEATPYYNKPSFLKKMSRVAKQERQAREKKEAEGKMKTFKNHITHNMPTNEEVELTIEEQLHEVLSKDAKAGDWISDFVKSDNPKFEGKSKKERIKMALGAYYGKQNEEVEIIDEALDPSEIASNPRMYSADSAKKAYYHKKASASDKESLARHLDRHHGNKEWRKPVKEEVVEESVVPDHMKGKQKPYVSSDGKGNYEVLGNTGQTKATFTRKEHGTNAQSKAREHLKSKYSDYMKEETLDEKFINGREYASHGLMHPDHAKMDIHRVTGHHVDFYASKTGDKMQGKVVKNDGKSVHIQAHKDKEMGDGKLHKFKVTHHLPKQNNEEFENGEMETTMKSYKEFMESLDEALWPGTPEYNKKFGGGANRSKGAETSTTHGKAIGTGAGVRHERDYEKAEKETPASEKQERRGRGRPAGSTSGARQKGTIAKSEYAGADYTGHKLHLPNNNR